MLSFDDLPDAKKGGTLTFDDLPEKPKGTLTFDDLPDAGTTQPQQPTFLSELGNRALTLGRNVASAVGPSNPLDVLTMGPQRRILSAISQPVTDLANAVLPETQFPTQINSPADVPKISVPGEMAKFAGREAIQFLRPDVQAYGALISPGIKAVGAIPIGEGKFLSDILNADIGKVISGSRVGRAATEAVQSRLPITVEEAERIIRTGNPPPGFAARVSQLNAAQRRELAMRLGQMQPEVPPVRALPAPQPVVQAPEPKPPAPEPVPPAPEAIPMPASKPSVTDLIAKHREWAKSYPAVMPSGKVPVRYVGPQLDENGQLAFQMVDEPSGSTVAYDPAKHEIVVSRKGVTPPADIQPPVPPVEPKPGVPEPVQQGRELVEIPEGVITPEGEGGFSRQSPELRLKTAASLRDFLQVGDIVERDREVLEKDASGNYVKKLVTDSGQVRVNEDGRKVIVGTISGGYNSSVTGLELDSGNRFTLSQGDRILRRGIRAVPTAAQPVLPETMPQPEQIKPAVEAPVAKSVQGEVPDRTGVEVGQVRRSKQGAQIRIDRIENGEAFEADGRSLPISVISKWEVIPEPKLPQPHTAKEPWMMTKAEFIAGGPEGYSPKGNYGWSKTGGDHAVAVATDIDEGKPVPASVLADYPDLQRQKVEGKSAGAMAEPGYVIKGQPFEQAIIDYEAKAGIGTFDKLSPKAQLEVISNTPEAEPVKEIIRKVTGQVRTGHPVSEALALRRLFQREAQVAKQAYQQGKLRGIREANTPKPKGPKQLIRESTGQVKIGKLIPESEAISRSMQRQEAAAKQAALFSKAQTIEQISRLFTDPNKFIQAARAKNLTPTNVARIARLYRIEPGATVEGPKGGKREAPLSEADIRRATAATEALVPPEGQPTGTPPKIPRGKTLVSTEFKDYPYRDLTEFQAGAFSGFDPHRAAEWIDRKPMGPTFRNIVQPIRKAEIEKRRENISLIQDLRRVSRNMKRKSKESSMLADYIEGKHLKEMEHVPDHIKATASWMRDHYDDLIDRVNDARAAVGKRPIQKRQDYMTHLSEDQSLWEQTLGALSSDPDDKMLRTAGKIKELIRGKAPFFRFGLPRKGGEYANDAIKAFETYADTALRVIHMTRPGRVADVYLSNLPPRAQEYFGRYLDKTVHGRLGPVARLTPAVIRRAIVTIKSRFAKGTILGNISSVAQQPFTLPATISATGTKPATMAAGWLMRGDGMAFAERYSDTLRGRMFELDLAERGMRNSIENFLAIPLEAADRALVAHAFLSGYIDAVQKGATWYDAIEAGDRIAQRTQSSFLESDLAPIFQDEVTSGFVQFQNTINGVFNYMFHDIKNSDHALYRALLFAGSFAALAGIYEELGIPHPDEISDFVPGLSSMRGGPAALRIISLAIDSGSNDKQKAAKAKSDLGRILLSLTFPGANQVMKTGKGFEAIQRGGVYSKKGRLNFPVRGTAEGSRALVFGPYGTKAGQAYIKRGFKPEPISDSEKALRRQMGNLKRSLTR